MSGKQKYWQASLSETLSSSESELDPNEPDTYAYTNRVHLAKQLMSLISQVLRKSELGLKLYDKYSTSTTSTGETQDHSSPPFQSNLAQFLRNS
jgi:hypothetical protein